MSQTCVIFCPTDTWGGVEKNVRLRAQELGDKNYKIIIVLLNNKFREKFDGLKNVEVISVNQRGGDINMRVVYNYYKILKKYKPYVVFSALKKDWFLVSFAAYLAKVPRKILYLGIKRKIRNGFKYKTVFKTFKSKVLVNSDSLKNDLLIGNEFFTPQNVFKIYNGFKIPDEKIQSLDFREKFNLPQNTIIIGCAGRFAHMKGFDLLPQILEKLPENVHVVHAGGGEKGLEIKEELLSSTFAHRIHFIGYQKDIIPFMKGIDLFLLPSRREGMANVLNEAMSVGNHIVSTRVSGSEELLADGEYGYLCDIEDVECLAISIQKIINNKKEIQSIKQIERIRKSFFLEQMISQTEHLFFRNLETFQETRC